MQFSEISKQVLGCCFEVHNHLGPGLLEQPYHNALHYEFLHRGIKSVYEAGFTVFYKVKVVGEYFADLVVANEILIEVKSVTNLNDAMVSQLINYLHISHLHIGYLVNFHGTQLEWKRIVL